MKKNLIILLLTLPFLSNSSDPGSQPFYGYSYIIDEIAEADIEVVYKHSENCYGAFLKNGDVVTATYLDKGSAAGEYHCSRHDLKDGIRLPLWSGKKYLDMLKRIYNTRQPK